jgi:hypothetical protein
MSGRRRYRTPEQVLSVSVVGTGDFQVLTLMSPGQKPPPDCLKLFGKSWDLMYRYVGGVALVSLYRST